ncbi:hypothetical protein L249_1642 [Ophiocordyceps polyrhachis-furcata BCC 54312]|uniref:UDP-glucose:glycoprotein glucosyltransferase n=1 Tax=Ophiocordyceps polyrhachis-furcata BCC 54312 TaxID=1330021 RepID=A0A367L049_9HYPO|nr:hypothetical protein L249_1642 [Ophiocordyceps polyrhachis-furcata BCC 54312]
MARYASLPWSLCMAVMTAMTVVAVPSVNVGMKAAFSAGPYLLELIETAAAENSTAYFPLLDRIAGGYFASASSDAALYNSFLDLLVKDGYIASPEALSTFKLALTLRSAAPRIEAHYQYYSTAVEPVVDSSCLNWVLLEGKQYCTPQLDKPIKEDLFFSSKVPALPFDRTLGSGKDVVLYADPISESFGEYHRAILKASHTLGLKYRVRYRRSEANPHRPLPVSGYGVELALKRTDYIVIDDRDAADRSQKPLTSGGFDDADEVADLRPLSTSELALLGLKTASLIQNSNDSFATLVRLTQDFPRYSASIAAHNVSEAFHATSEKVVPGGINFLWMNGVQLIERQIEPFALVEMLRRERRLVDGFRHLGFTGKQAISLLGHSAVSTAKGDDEALRYEWTDKPEDGGAIFWLNDLETDSRYEDYPKSLIALLQRTFPGQIPQIGRNVFNIISPVDFSNADDIAFVSQVVSIVRRGIPLRFGLIPLTPTATAVSQAKVAFYLKENHGIEGFFAYIDGLSENKQSTIDEKLFADITGRADALANAEKLSLSEVIEADNWASQMKSILHWIKRLRADTAIRPLFINGVVIPRDATWMQIMSTKISADLQSIQKEIFHGSLTEDSDSSGIFLKGAALRRNPYISVESDKALHMLDVSRIYSEHGKLLESIPVLEPYSESTKENWAVVTVLADLTAVSGRELILAALEFKRSSPGVRLELIHNPEDSSKASRVCSAIKTQQDLVKDMETTEELTTVVDSADGMPGDDDYAAALSAFLNMAKVEPGRNAIILNGRVVGPMASDETFTADDFQLLLEYEQGQRILPVYAAIDDLGLGDKLSNALAAAKATSVTALSTISDLPEGIFESAPTIRSTMYDSWDVSHATIEVGDPETASIHIAGLLDPASEKGQRWTPILRVLSELDGVYLKIILNPREKITELPLKRFFRYVMDAKPSFEENGSVKALKASFESLPSEVLLTAGMDVPPAWLVASKESVHDLDNVKLSTVKSNIDATYELEHILIEGHSREGRGAPPRGAQLTLATEKDPMITDTIIMSNLGFFQFKANPGFYSIKLKEGRTAEIYTIESIGAQGWEATPGDEGTELALMDFQGTTLYPRLKRRPGMEQADVLETSDSTSTGGILSKGLKLAEELLGGAKVKSPSVQKHADINIFSVASGHLYERMLNIMMVSVMRNTKHSVKFWFIEQFLSPSFKEFIPHVAEEYGFEYEMVTYKWPHWLRQQKEKQREIWGYKILFLDVLFPLSLDKVIFVDADQIVRTDMMDLVNLDLKGAPYGFAPMCDSRTEMEGFRFWKQGYWANYLRGRPYHISALYVVDLRRFRELAAGDRLRQQYHALSADPASLSNLDQDLPNHMQFEIPIHSLPQEWLWCETWCSDESLSMARTIDLCNNPQTKEPKLDRAKRQVPEWTVYDDEIAALDKTRRAAVLDGADEGREPINTKSRRLDGDDERNVHTMDEL